MFSLQRATEDTVHLIRVIMCERTERGFYDEDTGKKKEIKNTNRGRVNIGRRAVPFPVVIVVA